MAGCASPRRSSSMRKCIAELREFIPLAPLHQPHNLAGIEGAKEAFPHVPQVACFDTAFHRGHAFVDDAYALPYSYYERGLRRFGFHGLSYEYISRRLRTIDPIHAEGGVIVAHLGNGASLCAMKGGRSIATSMGFSALEGLPMGTRCGQIDPGLLLYLLRSDGMTPEELSHLLYERSGLLGLSGVSHDMRTLEASEEPRAQAAIAYFIHRIKMEIAALAAAIGGIRRAGVYGRNWRAFAARAGRRGRGPRLAGADARRGGQCAQRPGDFGAPIAHPCVRDADRRGSDDCAPHD